MSRRIEVLIDRRRRRLSLEGCNRLQMIPRDRFARRKWWSCARLLHCSTEVSGAWLI
jgi:hypothetical protein